MTTKQESRDNVLTILSVEDYHVYKKRPEQGVIKLATDIGLELIDLSNKTEDFPIRLATYERRKKGQKPQIVHSLEIDLDKPINIE